MRNSTILLLIASLFHFSQANLASATPFAKTVVYAAGDIGQCDSPGPAQTGSLLRNVEAPILALGDLAYRDGSADEFARCYAPHWGAFRERTYPAPGNHDYRTPNAAGYFAYFGARAGDANQGYYSFNLGAWHIVSLNSNRELEQGSPQLQWLEDDLRRHRQRCVLAYWHHPLYSSGPHGNDPRTQALWETLQRHGVSVILAGHDHDYERFPPMDNQGRQDEKHGMRSFVVGTGGAKLYELKQRHALSQAWNNSEWGVLKLTLDQDSYAWEFMPVEGGHFRDSGKARCNAR